jgi:uncharacterized protein
MVQARRPRYAGATEEPEDGFIGRTYGCFLFSLIAMVGCGLIGYYYLPPEWFLGVAIADGLLWVLCGWFGWRNPIGFVFPIFTITTGCFLGLLTKEYAQAGQADVVVSAVAITVVMFLSLSIYVLISKRNFSGLMGFLSAGFWILIGGFLLLVFFEMPLFEVALSTFGALVFLCWILYDTSQIVKRWNPDLTPGIAAFDLFLDLVGLFSYILRLRSLGDD